MRLAGAKIPNDVKPGGLRPFGNSFFRLLELGAKSFFDGGLLASEREYGVTVGNPGAQRFNGASRNNLCAHPTDSCVDAAPGSAYEERRIKVEKGLTRCLSRTSSQMRIRKAS